MPMDSSVDLSRFYRDDDPYRQPRGVTTEKFARKVKKQERHISYFF